MPDDLSALVRATLDAGTSLRDLERRAVDPVTQRAAGKDLLRKLASGTVERMPLDYHLRAVAAGLGASYEAIREAAIHQWLPLASEAQHDEDEREYRTYLAAHRPRFSKDAVERMVAVWREERRRRLDDSSSSRQTGESRRAG